MYLASIIWVLLSQTFALFLSNGHSRQIRQNGELLVRMCRMRVSFWRMPANVSSVECVESGQKGWRMSGECIESGQKGWRMSGECVESGQKGWRMSGECVESGQNGENGHFGEYSNSPNSLKPTHSPNIERYKKCRGFTWLKEAALVVFIADWFHSDNQLVTIRNCFEETLFVSDSSRLDQDANSGPKNGQARCASRAAALSTWPLKLPLIGIGKNFYWWN